MKKSEDEGFLRRWARRKEKARARQAPSVPPAPVPAAQAGPVARSAGAPEQGTGEPTARKADKPFDLSQLPPIDSLTKESDYTVFMRPEVPDNLRRQALRKLWVLDPILSAPDKLDIHAFDYNSVPTFPEGLKSTLYRVGRGFIGADEKSDDDKGSAAVPTEGATAEPGPTPAPQPPESAPPTDGADKSGSQSVARDSKESTGRG